MTRQERLAGLAGLGAVLIAARVALPAVGRLFYGVSLNQAQNVCSSSAGAVASLLDHQIASRCNQVSEIMTVLNLAGIAGIILAAGCGVMLYLLQDSRGAHRA